MELLEECGGDLGRDLADELVDVQMLFRINVPAGVGEASSDEG